MPQPLPGLSVDRNDTVGEQIITMMTYPYEIRLRRAGSNVSNAANLIHCHAGPAIGSVFLRPIPGVVTELAFMRDGVKGPKLLPRHYVKAPDILLKPRHHDAVLEN